MIIINSLGTFYSKLIFALYFIIFYCSSIFFKTELGFYLWLKLKILEGSVGLDENLVIANLLYGKIVISNCVFVVVVIKI